jgi:uncharacterized membrane protein YbhN (UPF0104 family)
MTSSELPSAKGEPIWRTLAPFAIAAALIAFVLSRLDLAAFLAAVQRVNHFALAAFAVAFLLSLLVTDCFATREIYRRTVADVDFKSLLILRAASYLPSILSHHLGQAWLTYFLAKAYKAPLWRVAGATLVVYGTVLGVLVIISSAALPFKAATVPWLAPALGVLVALAAIYLIVLQRRPAFLLKRQVTAPLVELGIKGHLVLVLYRVPHLVVLFLGNWIPFELFGVHIPLADALMLMPVVMLAASLPITPQGVGTRDAVALQLFAGFAAGTASERAATLAAATLSFAISLTLVQLVLSPLFLAPARRLLAGEQVSGQPARPSP